MSTSTIRVPFRCPDCVDTLQFETLKELRNHLETEHIDLYANAWRKQPHFPPGLFGNGTTTPILDMYHADAIKIEEGLLAHKRSELNNKQRRMNPRHVGNVRDNPRSTIRQVDRRGRAEPASFRQYGHSSRMEHKYYNTPRSDHRGRYLNDSFGDDDDVTRPKSMPRHIDRIHNVSSGETSVKKSNSDRKTPRVPEYVTNDMDSHVRETLSALSQEVVLSRANQHASADSLIASQEVYTSLEHSAQERICKQQEIIATLALKLSEKDEKLANLSVQVNSLRHRTEEEEVKNLLRIKSNQESEKLLHDDLIFKQNELLSLTERVENAKTSLLKGEKEKKAMMDESNQNLKQNMDYESGFDKTEKPEREINKERNLTKNSNSGIHKTIDDDDDDHDDGDDDSNDDIHKNKGRVSFPVNQARLVERDMLAKEKELVSLRSKSMQLESDRQTLLLEMQALLEIAANDNEKLRSELANQGKQLSKLNLELERSKQEQSELLGETNTLYQQADFSLTRLKNVLEERDTQLSSVSAQLDQARDMQGRLTKEREEYLKVAVEKEASYQVLVQENAIQLKNMRDSLDRSQVEKEKLQENLRVLKDELNRKEKEDGQMEERMKEMESQLNEHEVWQGNMKEQIRNKEDRLQKAKRSMEQMNSFMSDTANRELEARSRLEQFISNLIDRSTQTETELKKLREAYAVKEEAFKNLAEAQAKLPPLTKMHPQTIPRPGGNAEQMTQPYPTWQEETREELKRISTSNPYGRSERPYESLNGNSVPDGYTHPPTRHSSSNYQNMAMEEEDTGQEPTRLMSNTGQVRKNGTMDPVPERQLKNHPILIMGREFPHPSAYGLDKPKPSNSESRYYVDGQAGHPGFGGDKKIPSRHRNPASSTTNGDGLDMPVSYDGYHQNESPMTYPSTNQIETVASASRQPQLASSRQRSHPPTSRRRVTGQENLNNASMFTNTPEVEKMYQNVQKHSSYATNPANQYRTNNPLNHESEFYRGQDRLDPLPMDEYGIIWGPYDKSVTRKKTQKKKTSRRGNHKQNRRDKNFGGHKNPYIDGHQSDCEDMPGLADSDEDVRVLSQRRNDHAKQSLSNPYVQRPAPLGDKIALLLTSMAPNSIPSAARREYNADHDKNRTTNELDATFPHYTSDSEHSSPLVSARAVQERVSKVTASRDKNKHVSRDDATDKRHESVENQNYGAKKGTGKGLNLEYSRDGHQMLPRYRNGEQAFDSDSDQLKEDRSPSDTVVTVIEKPLDKDPEIVEKEGKTNNTPQQVAKGQDREMVKAESYNPVRAAPHPVDEIDGGSYPTSLHVPYSSNDELLESHNAESESEFSSSSYANLRPERNQLRDSTDYIADTLEEEEEDDDDVISGSHRHIEAQVRAEAASQKPTGNLDDEKSDETHSKRPSVSEIRERFRQNSSRESFVRSDSRRASLNRQESCVRSTSYDTVMKELMKKHPYISRDPPPGDKKNNIDDDSDTSDRPQNRNENTDLRYVTDDSEKQMSGYVSVEAQEFESSSPPTETIAMSVEKRASMNNGMDLVESRENDRDADSTDHDAESIDPGVMSSDDEILDEHRDGPDTSSNKMDGVEMLDASTDTDLEKLATPGTLQKPVGARKKKKMSSWAKKEKAKKQQKAALKLKDMAGKNGWTSVDADDPEELEREERLIRRRHRVALFCALAYTDTKSLMSASQVCQDWRKIAHHPALWKNIQLKDAKMDSQFLVTLSQWCTQTHCLSLKGLSGRDQKLMESEDDYNKSIRGSLEPGLERLLFSCQGTLKSLSIEGCENVLTDKCLWLVSSNCRMLSHLEYRSRVDPVHPQLLWALGGGCPGITSLYVHPYHESESKNTFNNRCLLQIGQFYRDLHEVGLGGMEFNMAGLLPFIQACQHLQSIHMDSCLALTDDLATAMCRAGLKDLHTFTLTHTAFQAKAIQTLHANCRLLKRIHVKVTPQSCGLDLQKKKEKDEYKKLTKGYKDLKKKAGLSHILTLDIQEVD